MCIFHEILSNERAFSLAPVVVALSGLQKGSTLFAELAALTANGSVSPGDGATVLVEVSKDPYRFLRALLSYEADRGHGNCALNALVKELAQEPKQRAFYDAAAPSASAKAVLDSSTVEEALKQVARAGHAHRPAFLEWFKDNPSSREASQALRVLEEVARDVLIAPPIPQLVTEALVRSPESRGSDCCQERPKERGCCHN